MIILFLSAPTISRRFPATYTDEVMILVSVVAVEITVVGCINMVISFVVTQCQATSY